jgi:hypothetical protein
MTNPPERQGDEEQREADSIKPRSASAARPVKKPRTPKPAAADSALPKKPFSMSYDGVSSAEYIQYMIDRGTR